MPDGIRGIGFGIGAGVGARLPVGKKKKREITDADRRALRMGYRTYTQRELAKDREPMSYDEWARMQPTGYRPFKPTVRKLKERQRELKRRK